MAQARLDSITWRTIPLHCHCLLDRAVEFSWSRTTTTTTTHCPTRLPFLLFLRVETSLRVPLRRPTIFCLPSYHWWIHIHIHIYSYHHLCVRVLAYSFSMYMYIYSVFFSSILFQLCTHSTCAPSFLLHNRQSSKIDPVYGLLCYIAAVLVYSTPTVYSEIIVVVC